MEKAGISNRRNEFFDYLIDLISQRGTEDETVRDLYDRYLPPAAPTEPQALETWIAKNNTRLFFSDTYGYRRFLAKER